MTTAHASTSHGAPSGTAAAGVPAQTAPSDALARLRLVLDRELVGVRRHELELAGRVPEQAARFVDRSQGMLELLFDDGAGGTITFAVAPGVRGDTVVPVLPAPQPTVPDGEDVSADEPFAELVGEALEDVSRMLTHVENPEEMRGLVLHLGGRMLVVYADLWELRACLLP